MARTRRAIGTRTRTEPVRGTGLPAAILRFGGFIPTLMTGIRNLNHYRLLRHHLELGDAPYNQHSISAQYAAAITVRPYPSRYIRSRKLTTTVQGIVCFVWSVPTFVLTAFTVPNATFVIGCVDLIFAIVFSIASGLQGAYIPHTKGTCEHAESWQVPSGTPSFFQGIANFPGNHNSAEEICKEYYTTWCILVATTGTGLTILRQRLKYICCPLCPLFPRFRYILGYTRKCLQRIRYQEHKSSSGFISLRIPNGRSKTNAGLIKILSSGQPAEGFNLSEKPSTPQKGTCHGSYDVLELVSRQLHHIDVVNLSLASKSVRKAIFPSFMQGSRPGRLRVYTCAEDGKTTCWACNTQICNLTNHHLVL
ncbi:hypothetical protein FQN54_000199 [Arachnomyces sp. PD_36]|nr:hypothetical protein FQN54_000199 [Arachnomyces sp. PD_36]